MKASYNWLREYVSFNITPNELADRLTMAGLEVESMQSIGDEIKQVIVGKVIQVEKHPNADKLSLCKVDTGSEILEIVCGAPNVAAGQKVPVALCGTELPGGLKIKKSKIRDVYSHGMICSQKELGLGEISSGIMVLPENVNIGKIFIDEMNLRDTILEINVTPNRPDCLSIIGIAREIACILRLPLNIPEIKIDEEPQDINISVTIENEAHYLCPRYTARVITGVKVSPSPFWLEQRLQSIGIRSINNIVDITNYILIEWGHPLHAFDARFISGNTIKIRQAKQGEKFETLDGVKRELTSEMLVIADKEKAIALAGVMGGGNSQIKDDTSTIILESAYFDMSSIRKTSKKLDLSTESSYRFERGTDINGLVNASLYASMLISKLADGKIAKGMIESYPKEFKNKIITLRPEKVNNILGTGLPVSEIENILVRLNFILKKKDKEDEVDFIIPSFRHDINREIDLIEEVSRIYGYDKIKVHTPNIAISSTPQPLSVSITNKIKNTLVSCGMNEIISFSFVCEEQFNKICLSSDDKRRNAVKIRNPLTPEQNLMRTLLLPSLLNAAGYNFAHGNFNLKLFETGRVFLPEEGFELPYEETYLGILLTGNFSYGFDNTLHETDIYDLKGILEILTDSLNLDKSKIDKYSNPSFHPNKCLSLINSDILLGFGGEIHPDVLENYKFDHPVFAMEISIDKLIASLSKDKKTFKPISIYPSIMRDMSLIVKENISHEELLGVIKESEKKLIEEIKLFDLYKGKNIPAGYKSMGYRLIFRSFDRTLKDEEIDKIMQKILNNLEQKLGITLRK
ncbi:phenylalanine--tRNA ligase subunit beta [Candidatus Desantisbacteria bacterium]|nr:phenylalanine--tRNA ligase subunit beta [Candidatus Desantisbacteria bacterium]